MAEDLVTYCQDLNHQLEDAKKNKADAEAEAYHRAHEIQAVVSRLNRYCVQQEWNICIPVPEVKKGVLAANPDLAHILERFRHHQESFRREITDLQNKIEERRVNLVKLRTKQETQDLGLAKLKNKEKDIKQQIQAEELSLNGKVKDMKDQLILRSNKNQQAKEDLMREVEELRQKLEIIYAEKVAIKEDIRAYQEKAVNMVKQTISEVLHTRDEAKKAVAKRDERYLQRQQEALKELKKLEESVNNDK